MFENALIESRQQTRSRRRLLTLPAALAAHAVALAVVMAVQLWAVEEVPEPILMATLVTLSPQPPAGGTPAATPAPRRGPTAQRHEVQPTSVSDAPLAPPTAPEPPEPTGVPGGDPEGGGGNGGSGDGRGVVLDVGPVPPAPPDPPMIIGGQVERPVLLRRVEPAYPEAARLAHRTGIVIVEAIVDTAGNVTSAHILADRVGYGCGAAVLDAVAGWRYAPARLLGRAVSVYLTITVEFTMH